MAAMMPLSPVVKRLLRALGRLGGDRRGATAVEYGLILAFVFLAMLVGLQSLGSSTSSMWNYVDGKVTNAH